MRKAKQKKNLAMSAILLGMGLICCWIPAHSFIKARGFISDGVAAEGIVVWQEHYGGPPFRQTLDCAGREIRVASYIPVNRGNTVSILILKSDPFSAVVASKSDNALQIAGRELGYLNFILFSVFGMFCVGAAVLLIFVNKGNTKMY
ncbi:MAG: hypothetical protein GY749_02365 [Desulfobacteraceae bacterium]|nr:hypothetical protein [Desulfobacteraceae bacterium]